MIARNPALQAKSRLISSRIQQCGWAKGLQVQTSRVDKLEINKTASQTPCQVTKTTQLESIQEDHESSVVASNLRKGKKTKTRKLPKSNNTIDLVRRLIFQNKAETFRCANMEQRYLERKEQLEDLQSRFQELSIAYNNSKPSERKSPSRRSESPKISPTSPQLRRQHQFMRKDTQVLIRMLDNKSEASDAESTDNLREDYETYKADNDHLTLENEFLRDKIAQLKKYREIFGNHLRIQDRTEMLEMENKDMEKMIEFLSHVIKEDARRNK